jgi:alpha-L-fucosidase 2
MLRGQLSAPGTRAAQQGGSAGTERNNQGGTYANLFDAHPPFQIDGNLGGAAGIGQMLVQSHSGMIHLLPALPRLWPSGRVSGLRARGNIGVDISWSAGALEEAVLTASSGGDVRVRSGDAVLDVTLRKRDRVRLTRGPAGLRMSRRSRG